MKFLFKVMNAGYMPTGDRYYLDVRVESGTVEVGDVGIVEDMTNCKISIRSVGIASGSGAKGLIPLTIDPPSIEISELQGRIVTG
ncbi:MAG: hypothetical protein ACFCD0_23715 [Gemmataceae bacterium]